MEPSVSPNLDSITGRWNFFLRKPLSSRHTFLFLSQLHPWLGFAHCWATPHAHLYKSVGTAPPQYFIFTPSCDTHLPPEQKTGVKTFVFDKVLTVRGNCSEGNKLGNGRWLHSRVINLFSIGSLTRSIYQRSFFTVVTNHCHANSIVLVHVALRGDGFAASLTIRIDDIRTAWGLRAERFDLTASFS